MDNDIKRILVVSRMSKYCQEAAHYGVSLARKYDAELFIIHVIHNPFGYEGWNLPIYSFKEEYQKIQQEAKRDLETLIAKERAAGVTVNELVVTGEPTEEILKAVKENNVDLMILLAHEEGHLEHFLFGRSNEALVRRMPCSILMVKKEPGPVTD